MLGYYARKIDYEWSNVSVPYKVDCRECGKTFHRVLSDGCNRASGKYAQELHGKLVEQAKEISQKGIVCTACVIKKLPKAEKNIIPFDKEEFKAIENIQKEIDRLETELGEYQKAYSKKHEGRIVIYKGEEWVVSYPLFLFSGKPYVTINRIHKRKPWEVTQYEEKVLLSAFQLTNEFIQGRENLVKDGL